MLPGVLSIANMLGMLVWIWLRVLILALEIRYLIQWFLNINPYFEPVLTLWNWTDPVFNFGRNYYPKVIGMDFAPIFNYKILQYIAQQVYDFTFDEDSSDPDAFPSHDELNVDDIDLIFS